MLVTSFKCSPDSFALESFRRILDATAKPYLILQLDDHAPTSATRPASRPACARSATTGAASGRPTRVVPSARGAAARASFPARLSRLGGRTLLLSDLGSRGRPLSREPPPRGRRCAGAPRGRTSIRTAMRHNTGQCLPAQHHRAGQPMDHVRHSPTSTRRAPSSGWPAPPCRATPGCSRLYEAPLRGRGRRHGADRVYVGDFFYLELSTPRRRSNCLQGLSVGGLLRRVGCRLRPYEVVPGSTDAGPSRRR